ncbi:hypothetical protein V8C86DRAFT_2644634 [Haematococcus lacustris]
MYCEVRHEAGDGLCTLGEGEVQHEGGQHHRRQLLQEQQDLVLEQLVECGLHLGGVGAASPVAGQVMCVGHHLLHCSLWVIANRLLVNESPAGCEHDPQGCQPPDEVSTQQRALQQLLIQQRQQQQQGCEAAGDEDGEARQAGQAEGGELADIAAGGGVGAVQPVGAVVRQLVELPQPPAGQSTPPPAPSTTWVVVEAFSIA